MNAQKLSKIFLSFPENTSDVLSLVAKYRLEYLLPSVKNILDKIENRDKKRNTVLIESALEITEDTKSKIEEKYNIKIDQVKINKKLIAGFKVYTRDKIVDASLDTLLAPMYR